MASFAIADVLCPCARILDEIIPVSSLVAIVQAYTHTVPNAYFWFEYLTRFGIRVNSLGQEITRDEAENSKHPCDYVHMDVGFLHFESQMHMAVNVYSSGCINHCAISEESLTNAHDIDTCMTHVQFPFYNHFKRDDVKRNVIQELKCASTEHRHLIGVALEKVDRRLKKIYGALNIAALLHSQ